MLYGKLKLDVVVSVVVESSSVVVPRYSPPMRSIPAGLCQDTWPRRSLIREWDCSHPPVKVRQLVSMFQPPHIVRVDCV